MSLQYLQTFFREKALDEQVYEVTANGGTTNWICTTEVIDALLKASGDTQAKAASIIRVIDHANGDIHHFLRHMAGGMAIDLEDLA